VHRRVIRPDGVVGRGRFSARVFRIAPRKPHRT
jgi:hypothetical protein